MTTANVSAKRVGGAWWRTVQARPKGRDGAVLRLQRLVDGLRAGHPRHRRRWFSRNVRTACALARRAMSENAAQTPYEACETEDMLKSAMRRAGILVRVK